MIIFIKSNLINYFVKEKFEFGKYFFLHAIARNWEKNKAGSPLREPAPNVIRGSLREGNGGGMLTKYGRTRLKRGAAREIPWVYRAAAT
jgi:hypothetical protein